MAEEWKPQNFSDPVGSDAPKAYDPDAYRPSAYRENPDVAEPPKRVSKGPAIAMSAVSLYLGINAISVFWYFGMGVLYAIPALILGIIGQRKAAEAGWSTKMAFTAKILAIISIVLGVIFFVIEVSMCVNGTGIFSWGKLYNYSGLRL